MHVLSVLPAVPPATAAFTPITVQLTITNTSSRTLRNLTLLAAREGTVTQQARLDSVLADPVETDEQTSPLPPQPVPGELAPRRNQRLTYTFTSSTINQHNVLCLCQRGIYPVDFSLHASADTNSVGPEVGWTQTYIPSLPRVASLPGAAPVQVSWLWPLLDRPHRLTDDRTFVDDDLAASVSPGGRLDRALEVIEQTYATARLTLVTDPELIDELIVMTDGYQVSSPKGLIAGTGRSAAQKWLNRLQAVLQSRLVSVSMTPWADPDVDAVARAGLSWSSSTPIDMQARITKTLGVADPHDIAWPAGQTITDGALAQLVATGTKTVLVDDATLPRGRDDSPPPAVVASVRGSTATAVVTSQRIGRLVAEVINGGAPGLAALPALVSTVAMPAVEDDADPQYLVLVPDRHVSPDPVNAAQAIMATTSGPFTPLAVQDAVAHVPSRDHGPLTAPAGSQAAEIPADLLATATAGRSLGQTFASLVDPSDSARLLAGFPAAVQRVESAGWRSDPATGLVFAASFEGIRNFLTGGVQIIPASRGSYTLASNDAPLFVTVRNTLPVAVRVRVVISTVGGVVGFHTDDVGVQVIPADDRRMIKLQAHVNRAGHFIVQASLRTPAGSPLGRPQRLSIYSKALGTIGVVITVVAVGVLFGVLVVRFAFRFRLGRRQTNEQGPPATQLPAGVSQ